MENLLFISENHSNKNTSFLFEEKWSSICKGLMKVKNPAKSKGALHRKWHIYPCSGNSSLGFTSSSSKLVEHSEWKQLHESYRIHLRFETRGNSDGNKTKSRERGKKKRGFNVKRVIRVSDR